MNLNKDIIDFKEPELRKKVDRIQYEREMTSIAVSYTHLRAHET